MARDAETIIRELGEADIDKIGGIVLALSDKDRRTLAVEFMPSQDELQTYIDDISDPTSPNYDPDLAS